MERRGVPASDAASVTPGGIYYYVEWQEWNDEACVRTKTQPGHIPDPRTGQLMLIKNEQGYDWSGRAEAGPYGDAINR